MNCEIYRRRLSGELSSMAEAALYTPFTPIPPHHAPNLTNNQSADTTVIKAIIWLISAGSAGRNKNIQGGGV